MFIGSGNNWGNASNWSCGNVPAPSSDNVTIPTGKTVVNNDEDDFSFENGKDLKILGSLDMNGKKIEMKSSNSSLTVNPSGSLTDVKELFFNSGGDGTIKGNLTAEHLKTDDNSEVTINSTIFVTDKLESLSSSEILGSGAINFSGSSFTNTGKGIFGCTSNVASVCLLSGGGTLPIELISFQVTNNTESKKLTWITASEVNNDFFTLEKSTNNTAWEILYSTKGAGQSSQKITYSFNDFDQISGIAYYRLKQTDFDGETSYSHVVSTKTETLQTLTAFPNPFDHEITFNNSSEHNTTATLYNIDGRPVLKNIQFSPGMNTLSLPQLNSGIYFIKFGNSVVRIQKL